MAGPKKATQGEAIRPRFNIWTIFDHALGEYVKGDDGLWYLNGGFGHIMGFAGRGNTFKSFLLDYCIMTILLRYRAEWASKYDTEVSAQLSRMQTVVRCVCTANGWDFDYAEHAVEVMMEKGCFNMQSSELVPGEQWWADYIRDEVEDRYKQYMARKNLRETPFPDPIRKENKKMLNPWAYGCDSLSEWKTSKMEDARDDSNVGDSEQNALAAQDAKQKSDMMGRWPNALARGHFYMGFVVHITDNMQMGRIEPGKKLDEFKGNIKFANVPGRAVTFLTNSLLVATHSGDCKQPSSFNSKTGVEEPMFPSAALKGKSSSVNDLKIIRYTQFRAKSGPTGVKMDMIYSQELGFMPHLSLWYYLKETLTGDFGFNRSGHFYELQILPGVKFGRTTIFDMALENRRLQRALEITAGLAYMQNNWFRLEPEYHITPQELYDKVKEAGFDWDEILDNTVEYWQFKDQETKTSKRCVTVKTLLDMALKGLKPKFLTVKK